MRDREREMAEEMRLHLEHRIDQKIAAGMTPADARAAAFREFGNVEAVKLTAREQRRTWRIATALRDVKFGVRVLIRNPGFALTAILTLALGVGANVAVFSVVRAVLIEELAFPDARRVVTIALQYELMRHQTMTVAQIDAIAAGAPAMQVVSGSTATTMAVRGDADTERAYVEQVLPGFFEVFRVTPTTGRTLGQPDFSAGTKAAVLSDALWRRQFSGRAAVDGARLRIGAETFDVVGVMPPDFYPNPSTFAEADLWIPAAPELRTPLRQMRVIGRVAPTATPEEAAAQIDGVINQDRPRDLEFSDRVRRYLGTAVAPLGADGIAAVRPGLVMLQALSIFLLAIACANLGNVFLSHASSRSAELSVRAALGAGRGRLIGQLLAEASVIAVIGAVLGLTIAFWSMPALVALGVNVLPRNVPVAIHFPELLLALSASMIAALFFAGVPAWLMARADPFATMRGVSTSAGRGARVFRSALVAAQMLLAIVVLAGAGLLTRSFMNVLSQPLGFDPRGLITGEIELPTSSPSWRDDVRALTKRLEAELHARFGRDRVVVAEDVPYRTRVLSTEFAYTPAGSQTTKIAMADVRTTAPGALEFLGVAGLRGRMFTAADEAGAAPVVLVNEAFVELFASGQDVIGTRLDRSTPRPGLPPATIIGVVATTRSRARSLGGQAAVYYLAEQRPSALLTLAIRGVAAGEAAAGIRAAVRAVDPNVPVTSIGALEQKIADAERRRCFYLSMLTLFALLAVALAAVGIYGVVAHVVGQRSRELGIRLALGARPRGLVQMVVHQSVTPIALGVATGLIAAWWLASLMQTNAVFKSQLFQITAHDPVTFVVVPVLLSAIAIVACWIPARRAALASVTEVLRNE